MNRKHFFTLLGIITLVLIAKVVCPSAENIKEALQQKTQSKTRALKNDNIIKNKAWFNHSDVFAFVKGSVEDYEAYGVTFVSWGGYPGVNPKSVARYRQIIQEAIEVGTKIGAKIGTRTESKAFIDLMGIDCLESRILKVDGTPVIAPNREGVTYKGYPAYWFCTNNPKFREFLKTNVKRAMECEPYGIMMDDPLGTVQAARVNKYGGCYCKYCVDGFRKYLKTQFTQEELATKGITDIEHFDLRKHHAQFAHLPADKRPLHEDILHFQFESSAQMFREIRDYALQVRGKRIPASGNINPASRSSGRLFTEIDYFSCECAMGANTGILNKGKSLLAFKVADSLKRPASIMGSGGDHAFIQEKNLPGMIRCWIAEAYAFGNYFMASYRLWAYTPEKGSHSYRPRHKSELAPMYQFIRRHADLFDDYEVVSRVALVHSYEAYRKGSKSVGTLVNQLADLNAPFEIIIAGDKVLKVHLTESQLKKYDIIIVPSDAILTNVDSAALEQFKADGGILIDEIKKLDFSTQIRIVGAKRIRATLRSVPTDLSRPVIVHLLNRNYDVDSDSCQIQNDFIVRIPKKLLDGRQIQKVRYVRPNSWEPKKKEYFLRPQKKMPDLDLTFETSDDYIEVRVPEFDVWGIVVLY